MSQPALDSSFGEKLFDSNCKALVPPQSGAIDAVAEVWTLGIMVKASGVNSVFVPHVEARVEASNYRVSITASNGLNIVLSQFGNKYDNFAKKLGESWGDALAKALLMEEANVVYEAPCFYINQDPHAPGQAPSPCRARIYETVLVILPTNILPIRFPFSRIQSVDLQNFKVRLAMRKGAVIELSRLANATQFFVEKLREAMKAVEAISIETIRTNVPSATFDELQRLSWLMMEGRAASRIDVERISQGLWTKLEKSVGFSPLAESYRYISSIAVSNLECVGLRKSKDVVYVWFMIPVIGSLSSGGNAVIMEVTSETGHATYLFRVMPRGEFATASAEKFSEQAAAVLDDLNEAITATGFRREPIYLTEDQLNTQEFSKYLYAADHLEALKLLRERFFARIIHNSFDQWKSDLSEALLFNTITKDEAERWSKSKLDFVETQELTPAISTPNITEMHPAPMIQNLNVEEPCGQPMPDKVVVLSRMEGDDNGNVKLCLHDNEFDQDIWVMISGDDAMKLGAFPGTKVKLSLQKNA
jgi:hypothetical protein